MSHSIKSILLACSALLALGASGCADLTPCERGTEGCACFADDTCNDVEAPDEGRAACFEGTCVVQRTTADPTVCYDACTFRSDGACDDGGEGSAFDDCQFGSDCDDCGPRLNPCAGGPNPVFCPQAEASCWPSNIDCLTVRTCQALVAAMRGPFGCPDGQAIACDAVGGPKCVATSVCQSMTPARTPCVNEGACVPEFADCNSYKTCGATSAACYTGEMVVCDADPAKPPSCAFPP